MEKRNFHKRGMFSSRDITVALRPSAKSICMPARNPQPNGSPCSQSKSASHESSGKCSPSLPAMHGPCVEVGLAEHLPDDSWLALLLCEQGDPFGCGLRAGMQIDFAEGLKATVISRDENIPRLWKLRFSISGTQLVD